MAGRPAEPPPATRAVCVIRLVVPSVTRDDAMEPKCDKTCPALAARAIEVRKAVVNIGITANGEMVIKC